MGYGTVERTLGGDLAHAIADETAKHEEALEGYQAARRFYVDAAFQEDKLECDRATLKAELIAREMATGIAYTPAEKKVAFDPEYLAHIAKQRETVRVKEDAWTRATVQLARADLALARLRALAGIR